MGIGLDNVYLIKTDSVGKMDMDHLESEIVRAKSEGALPVMVSATAGTTVLGAFDPLEQIAEICKKYNIWMHVDVSLKLFYKNPDIENFVFFQAAWGGGALMSRKYRTLLKGIEK